MSYPYLLHLVVQTTCANESVSLDCGIDIHLDSEKRMTLTYAARTLATRWSGQHVSEISPSDFKELNELAAQAKADTALA